MRRSSSHRRKKNPVDLQIFAGGACDPEGSLAAIARRVAVIRWFAPEAHLGQAARLTQALRDHAAAFGLEAPESVQLLDPSAGRQWLLDGSEPETTDARQRLEQALAAAPAGSEARQRLWLSGIAREEGAALVLHPGTLPVHQEALIERLAAGTPTLPLTVVRSLVDHLLEELGALFGLHLLGVPDEENPFLARLALHEEGFIPLATSKRDVVLWAPSLPPSS